MASLSLIFLGLAFCFSIADADPEVHAPWGQILGVSKVSENWSPYHAYYSIPYALPPIGSRRFQKPVAHPGVHKGVFNATTRGYACIQSTKFNIGLSLADDEDCLTLDVFTPVMAESPHLAVIVYIHGGGFISGAPSAFSADTLASKDVIIVMIRYRLSVFGFLSTGDNVAKGNYGLWDQHMALQWVQRNIRAFGGDPNRVTLMGESAGSASVAYQALYEGSKGLFQRTLMQSGAATSSWALDRNPAHKTYLLAKTLGFSGSEDDHQKLVDCLRTADVRAIANASWPVDDNPLNALADFYFVPVVDGEFVKDEPLTLMSSPRYLQSIGFTDRDSMVAINNNEGSLLLLTAGIIDQSFGTAMGASLANRTIYKDSLVPMFLELYFGKSTFNMVDAVERTYLNTTLSILDIQDVLDTYADPAIDVPTISFAVTLSELQTTKSNFMYLFDHTPTVVPKWARPFAGMGHGQDQLYVMGLGQEFLHYYNITDVSPDERKMSDLVMSFITDYAKFGNPQGAVSKFTGLAWPEFTSSELKYLDLKSNPEIRSHPYRKRFELWTKTLPDMLKNSPQTPVVG